MTAVSLTAEPPLPGRPDGRPGAVAFVAASLCVTALMAALTGVAVLVYRDDVRDATGRSGGFVLATAIAQFSAAALLVAVAVALLRGSRGARLTVTIVVGANMGLAAFLLIAHDADGVQWSSLVDVALGVAIVWALYGNERSQQYFDASPVSPATARSGPLGSHTNVQPRHLSAGDASGPHG